MAELTAHRALGLRNALAERPDIAFVAALHVLTLTVFYHYGSDSCLQLGLKSVGFSSQSPGLNDSAVVEAASVGLLAVVGTAQPGHLGSVRQEHLNAYLWRRGRFAISVESNER